MAKQITVNVGTANYGTDFTIEVDGLDPELAYHVVLSTPEGQKTWEAQAPTPEGFWGATYPCNFRGPYRVDVYGPSVLVASGEGRGVA